MQHLTNYMCLFLLRDVKAYQYLLYLHYCPAPTDYKTMKICAFYTGTTQENKQNKNTCEDLTCVWAAMSHKELGEQWLYHALQNTCK